MQVCPCQHMMPWQPCPACFLPPMQSKQKMAHLSTWCQNIHLLEPNWIGWACQIGWAELSCHGPTNTICVPIPGRQPWLPCRIPRLFTTCCFIGTFWCFIITGGRVNTQCGPRHGAHNPRSTGRDLSFAVLLGPGASFHFSSPMHPRKLLLSGTRMAQQCNPSSSGKATQKVWVQVVVFLLGNL